MIALRNFTKNDCDFLICNFYPTASKSEVSGYIDDWDKRLFNDAYFEMFAVMSGNEIVGSISIYAHEYNVISAGPTIIDKFKKMGYGFQALELVLEYAKQKGYTKAAAQVRKNNIASIKLHDKCGFIIIGECTTTKGNKAILFEKNLS